MLPKQDITIEKIQTYFLSLSYFCTKLIWKSSFPGEPTYLCINEMIKVSDFLKRYSH